MFKMTIFATLKSLVEESVFFVSTGDSLMISDFFYVEAFIGKACGSAPVVEVFSAPVAANADKRTRIEAI